MSQRNVYTNAAIYYAMGRNDAGEDIPGAGTFQEIRHFGELYADARIAYDSGDSNFMPGLPTAWDAFHATNAGSIHRLH